MAVGVKIICVILSVVVFIAIGLYFSHKISSIRCYKCNKPILIKGESTDQTEILDTAYDECYFCGEKVY